MTEGTHPMRCGAKTRSGTPCRSWPVRGRRRCRMHGGRSTGARTPEGLARIAAASTIHGGYSKEARSERAQLAKTMRAIRLLGQKENTEAEYQEIAEGLAAAEAMFSP